MINKIALYSLRTFSSTGGIQKMTRTLAHSLHTLACRDKREFKLWSVYDNDSDLQTQYLPADNFRGFGGNRRGFVIKALFSARESDIIILSHINLAIAGLLIKLVRPKCKVWLIAHGIEVWRPLPVIQRAFLKYCDKVICVSNFTKQDMIKRHRIEPAVCEVLNNAVDPFMQLPGSFSKPGGLLKRYNLAGDAPVLFTLTRLASTEHSKGYDQVIQIIGKLKLKFPRIKYLLSGPCDEQEGARIRELIRAAGAEDQVVLTGFITDEEITGHFLLADLFVLPSKKEGFGIVFIEALACGLPVICGNRDGSVDAIRNGELGVSIDPDDPDALFTAIEKSLETPINEGKRGQLQAKCLEYFNETQYMSKLEQFLYE